MFSASSNKTHRVDLAFDTPVANNGNAIHTTIPRKVIGKRIMHGDAIVPHGKVAGRPSPPDLIFRFIHMVRQKGFERVSVICRKAHNVSDKSFIEVEKLAARNGMPPD